MKKLLLFAIAIIGFSAVSFGQITISTDASATIIGPISMEKNADLAFGNIAAGITAGTVVMNPVAGTAGRTADGGATLPALAGTVSAAKFTVSGEGDRAVAITLPTTDLFLVSGGDKMKLNLFKHSAGITPALASSKLVFYVGATLYVSENQPTGSYTAPFDVTVNYN